MWDFFDETDDIKGYEKGKKFEYKKGDIKLEKINFGYIEKTKIFENFDLEIKGGKITALVGNSGSGKTTLVKLISGYIKADSGSIVVDEQKLENVSLKSFYKNIGYLTQEPSVFDGSILDNLMYGAHPQPLPSKEGSRDVWQKHLDNIIKQAKCEFIYDLEDGINTEMGEKGIRLSGGQRQRLAIAKIFLKDPKIIILDEPTSALDSFSEEQITNH
ncbi:MAG: ATP-binding cassette domain-containing protein [Candidatus Gracilibacteria bacterium]|nr:ATP-binding cassette domain-containing protein [Candidatus Gracilibacteria bacterium]